MPICDTHLHTRLSDDAPQDKENNVMSCCKQAISQGIKYIAFTEHRDICTVPGSINADLYELEKQCSDAKKEFDASLMVMFGAELAHEHEFMDEAAQIIATHDFDFVLGSLHKLKNGTDAYYLNFDEYTDEALVDLYDSYVDEIIKIAQIADFDSLAHITYPLRYFRKAGRQKVIDLEKYYDRYDVVFDALIERNKALEINTSSYAEENYDMPMPTYGLIERYIQRGGKLFTIGSDSHDYRRVGFGVDKAQRFLLEHGIDKLCVFKKRQMYFIDNVTE